MAFRTVDFSTNVTDGNPYDDNIIIVDGLKITVTASGAWTLTLANGRLEFSEDPNFGSEQFRVDITPASGNRLQYNDYQATYSGTPSISDSFPTSLQIDNVSSISPFAYSGSFDYSSAGFGTSATIDKISIFDYKATANAVNPTSSFTLDNLSIDDSFPGSNPGNSPPTATNLSAPETYTEDTPLNLTNIVITDADSANVTARLTLSNPGAGSLSTGTSGAVTATYDAVTGIWLASGAKADVNALLAAVTFTPAANFHGSFTITTSVSDGVAAPVTGSKAFTGLAVNDAPSTAAAAESGSGPEDQAITGTLLAGSDVDGDGLTFALVANSAQHGAVVIDPNTGAYTFTPDANYSGPAQFQYVVHDGTANSQPKTVSLTLTPVNDAPVIDPAAATGAVTEDQNVVLSKDGSAYLSEDFSDNSAGWQLGTEWQIGSAAASGGQSYGNPDPAVDHTPGSDNGVAGVAIGGNAGTGLHGYDYLTSPAVDTSAAAGEPVKLDFSRWLNSDYTPFMANQIQVYDGASWQTIWETGSAPAVHDGSWVDQSFDITAYSNAALQVRFGFTIGSSGVSTVSSWNLDDVLIYTPTPHLKTSGSISFTDPEAADVSTVSAVVLKSVNGSTSDLSGAVGALTATVAGDTAATAGGTIEWSYTVPNSAVQHLGEGEHLTLVYTVTLDDGHGGTAEKDITVTVTGVNDAPTVAAAAESASGPEDQPLTGTLLAGSDVDGDTLTFALVAGSAQHGSVVIAAATGAYTFTPDADYNGAAQFSYVVNDGTADSQPKTVSLTLTPVNDAPSATAASLGATEDTPKTITLAGSDVDGDALTYTVASGPLHGTLSGSGANLTYTPAANYHGADSFTFVTNDGQLDSAPATISLTIGAVNDPVTGTPVIQGKLIEGQVLTADTASLSDLDGLGTLHFQWERTKAGVTTNVGTDSTTYKLGADDVGAQLDVRVSYTDADGTPESVTSVASALVKAGGLNATPQHGVLTQDAAGHINFLEFSGAQLTRSNLSSTALWGIRAEGDFNNDGRIDLVTQDKATGQIDLVFLDNQGGVQASALLQGSYWHVVGAGDFDGSGRVGIATQNQQTGEINLLTFTGTQLTASHLLNGTYWGVVGVADVNEDGRADFVTQETAQGGRLNTLIFQGSELVASALTDDPYLAVRDVQDTGVAGRTVMIAQDVATGQINHMQFDGTTLTASLLEEGAYPNLTVVDGGQAANEFWHI